MFTLFFEQHDGYDGGTTTTLLFCSSEESTLADKIDEIQENRNTGRKLYEDFKKNIDSNPSSKRLNNHTRTDEEVKQIEALAAELDFKYPLWDLSSGCEGEAFNITLVEEI